MNTPSAKNPLRNQTFAVGDLVEYKPFGWVPAEQWLITRAWYQHETRDTAGVWRLEMVNPKTGEKMSESGHRVLKLSSAA